MVSLLQQPEWTKTTYYVSWTVPGAGKREWLAREFAWQTKPQPRSDGTGGCWELTVGL